MIGEKRLACDPAPADDLAAHVPVFTDLDSTRCIGLWAIIDHLEGNYPDYPLIPEDAAARGEALRWLDWAMSVFAENVTRKIVYEKANPRYTGSPTRGTPDMNIVRTGRLALGEALTVLVKTIGENGNLAGRVCTIADLALAAQFSALDYFGEVGWDSHPVMREWYVRMKSRPSFRSLLGDRVPGQPPVAQYAELDF